MPKFYLCNELNCNRKYITKEKLIIHLLSVHDIIKNDNDIGEPIEITRENKKIEQAKKNKSKMDEERNEKIKEVKKREQLELDAKLKAEEEYKQEQIEKYMLLEEKKLLLEEERIILQNKEKEIDNKWISLVNLIQNKIEKNPQDCSICAEKMADTACVPCGHKNFCYECIDSYFKTYTHRGCPVCRSEIIIIVKIYS